ncbi:MAG: hypothetical protein FWG51_00305 [Firmicutes bacterium]|nr:hypothetical protein [Bacillota bacterium]
MIDFEFIKKTLAYKVFKNEKDKNILSHCYIFYSQSLTVLSDLQKYILCAMFCKESEPCLECSDCRRALQNIHPDIRIYPERVAKINVEQTSDFLEEIYLKPQEKDFKVFVLNKAEEMSSVVQNKLLKILEEPPKNTHIFLFCQNKAGLLNTVLSRAKLLEIPNFKKEEILDILKQKGNNGEICTAAEFSFGNIDRAKEILEDKGFLEVFNFCYDLLLNLNSKNQIKYTNKFSKFSDNISDIFSILQLIIMDAVYIQNGAENLVNQKNQISNLEKISKFYSLKGLIKLIDKINELNFNLKFNCNITITFDILSIEILKERDALNRR